MSLQSPDFLIDQLSCGVLLLSAEGVILYLNQTAANALGRSPQRLIGCPLEDLLQQPEALQQALRQARMGQTRIHRDSQWHPLMAPALTLDYRISPRDDQLLLEFQLRDRALELDAQAQNQSKQATHQLLMRGMAHEIKNPLGGIRGAAQLLQMEQSNRALDEYTQVIIQEVDRLNRLVDRMLGTKQALKLESVNIHQVLERVCQLLLPEMQQHAITLERDYDPSLPELEGDAEQLLQVLLNLGRNACQSLTEAHPAGARITLRSRILRQITLGTKRHRLACQIEVEDNGPGIPKGLEERLFYPMIGGRAEGTGLGLCLAQGIAQQHQGQLSCHSTPGCCRFSLILPLEQAIGEPQ